MSLDKNPCPSRLALSVVAKRVYFNSMRRRWVPRYQSVPSFGGQLVRVNKLCNSHRFVLLIHAAPLLPVPFNAPCNRLNSIELKIQQDLISACQIIGLNFHGMSLAVKRNMEHLRLILHPEAMVLEENCGNQPRRSAAANKKLSDKLKTSSKETPLH